MCLLRFSASAYVGCSLPFFHRFLPAAAGDDAPCVTWFNAAARGDAFTLRSLSGCLDQRTPRLVSVVGEIWDTHVMVNVP